MRQSMAMALGSVALCLGERRPRDMSANDASAKGGATAGHTAGRLTEGTIPMASTQDHSLPKAAATGPVFSAPRRLRSGDEHELRKDIERRVSELTGGGIQDLVVEVYSHRIILQGRCWTFYCKQLAQHAAMQLAPGEQIDNRIDVVTP
jgi:hypothetical protein